MRDVTGSEWPRLAAGSVIQARHVVAGVLVHDGRVLLCHRRDDASWYPGAWDLVGGHVEPGECPRAALVRECREELGIDGTEHRLLTVVAEGDMVMYAYVVSGWNGEPFNAAPEEHRRIAWFSLEQLTSLNLADERIYTLAGQALRVTAAEQRPGSRCAAREDGPT